MAKIASFGKNLPSFANIPQHQPVHVVGAWG
jgi:hypothetical protein